MCAEITVVYFGCTCRIQPDTNSLLGITPCSSGPQPQICDPRLNGRSRFPLRSPATRFIDTWCEVHVKENKEPIDDENEGELLPACYPSVRDFLLTKAFDNNEKIKRVKGRLAFQAMMLKRLMEQLEKLEKRKMSEEKRRCEEESRRKEEAMEASVRAKAAQATAEREAVERAAGAQMGALRPRLGTGFEELTLRKRFEEAKAHKALFEMLVRKEKFVQEARNAPVAPSSLTTKGESVRSDNRPGIKRRTFNSTTDGVSVRERTAAPISTATATPTPSATAKTHHTAWYKTKPLRATVETADTKIPTESVKFQGAAQIASSGGLPTRLKPSEKSIKKPNDKMSNDKKPSTKEPSDKKLGNVLPKVLDLDGNDLYA